MRADSIPIQYLQSPQCFFFPIKKQPSRGVLKKGVLKMCSKFTVEHPCRSVISLKLLCRVELYRDYLGLHGPCYNTNTRPSFSNSLPSFWFFLKSSKARPSVSKAQPHRLRQMFRRIFDQRTH